MKKLMTVGVMGVSENNLPTNDLSANLDVVRFLPGSPQPCRLSF